MALTEKQQNWYIEQLRELDPNAETVSVDGSARLITYCAALRTDESRTKQYNPEEFVHATVIATLVSKAFRYRIGALYHEKYYQHGSAGSNADEVDILIEDDDGLPYALWELKPSSEYGNAEEKAIQYQLFGTAPLVGPLKLLVYATVHPNSPLKVELKCIDYTKYKSFEAWNLAGRPFSTVFPEDYQDLEFHPFENGGKLDLNLQCTQSEFRNVAYSFHNEFFGEHPDNALFVNLVKCLLAKIHDERTTKKGQRYRFQVLQKNSRPQSAKEVFSQVNTLYKDAYKRYIDPNANEPDEIDPKEFSPEKVKAVVQELQSMSVTKGAALYGDVIGAFFEEILRVGFKQDKGMYFTHSNIVRFMIEALDLRGLVEHCWNSSDHPENRLPYIIDPACGSGTFLLNSMQVVTDHVRDNAESLVDDFEAKQFYDARLSESQPNYWAENFIYGFDPKFIMAITAKVNMVLHGDGSAHIFKQDCFSPLNSFKDSKLRPLGDSQRVIPTSKYRPDACESFDVVLSNPPFGITLARETKRSLAKSFMLPLSTPSEGLFIERCFQLLKPNGRMGIVIPESVLNASDLFGVRKLIYRCFEIKAIVSLPRNAFIDTPTLTSLLFARKKTKPEIEQWDKVWDASHAEGIDRLDKAKKLLLKNASKVYDTPFDFQEAIINTLGPLVDRGDWILKKGKSAAVLTLELPSEISDVEEAVQYYRGILKSAAMERFVDRYAFNEAVKIVDYSYPAFLVDEVGFKLSKRKEKARPNQLCKFIGKGSGAEFSNLHLCNEDFEVSVDFDEPKTVIDHIRSQVLWSQ